MLYMHGAKFKLFLVYLLYYYVIAEGSTTQDENTSITISLNKTYRFENREIYGKYMNIQNHSTIKVNFTKLPLDTNISFLVFQAHSFINNITVYQNKKAYGSEVTGTNVGMVSTVEIDENAKPNVDKLIRDIYYIENNNDMIVKIYLSVHVYGPFDPYPGGCNTEFQVDISPYLVVKTERDFINVDAAMASLDPQCSFFESNLTKFFMLYLPEMNFDEDMYFEGIQVMMTLEYISQFGTMLPQTSHEMRRTLSAYPGNGVIIVALAVVIINNNTGYSVYVPNHSYGCPNWTEDGCILSYDIFPQALCVCLVIAGLFITFFGQRFFKTEMFLSGFVSGFIISYIMIILLWGTDVNPNALLAGSLLSGSVFGVLWLLLWWMHGVPLIAVWLPLLNVGFLIASIFYYKMPAIVQYFRDDINFWPLFHMLMLLPTLLLVCAPFSPNTLCCAIVGGYATIFGLDYWFGSNLKYIVINTVRRAVVPKFQSALMVPPFQFKELTMTIVWFSLAFLGWNYQNWYNREQPSYPPSPRSTQVAVLDSATAYGAVNANPTIIMQKPRSLIDSFRASFLFKKWVGPKPANERTPLVSNA